DRPDNTDIDTTFDAGYTAQTNAQIISRRMRGVTVNTRSYETFNQITADNDQWGQLTISTIAGAQLGDACVHLRAANAATVTSYAGCVLVNGANTLEIREYTTGTPVVSAGNATYTPVAGDKIRFEMVGTAMSLYLLHSGTETLAVSATDASIASGKTGLSV